MKFLEKRDKAFLLRFEEKLWEIRKDPYHPLADVEPYKWYPWDYRLRIGKYRFLYTIKEAEIVIYFYDADSRDGMYK